MNILDRIPKPKVECATLVRGEISGPIRCESIDGTELWLPQQNGVLHIPPFECYGKTFGVSHMQKRSLAFTLLFSPFCYHFARMEKLQESYIDANGVTMWRPGSERGIVIRTPGWRWQIPDKASNWSPWVFTGGRIGRTLD